MPDPGALTSNSTPHSQGDGRVGAPRRSPEQTSSVTMRELGKLTADQVSEIDHPVPVTSNGLPVAWLVPLSPSERRRAEMIAAGRLIPRRRETLTNWSPLPAVGEGPKLSELLMRMREQERT